MTRAELDERGLAEAIAAFGREADTRRERVADWARRLCPVDTGRLRASIHVDGEDVVCGGPGADYWATVEFGSVPHIIRPRTARALSWPGAAHPVAVVHHPGTPEFAFMRRAFYGEAAR